MNDVIQPELRCAQLPSIGGKIKCRPEDFIVIEIPSYPADGKVNAHILLTMEKINWSTEPALNEISRILEIPRKEIGLAGLKDRDALTTQMISLPWEAEARLPEFSHPDIKLGIAEKHGNKLRRGHLKGNTFEIIVRDLMVSPDEALVIIKSRLEHMQAQDGGFLNYYGPQRFGYEGLNVDKGLTRIRNPRRMKRADLMLSALQSAMFNAYLNLRVQSGLLKTVLQGDVLRRTDTGGMFTSEDKTVDQERLHAGELALTGPIFGSKYMASPVTSEASELDDQVLDKFGITRDIINALGKKGRGSRRPLIVPSADVCVNIAPGLESLSPGVSLKFELPAGSYASRIIDEACGLKPGTNA
jgi:tRNA pseudouridine13 synthase